MNKMKKTIYLILIFLLAAKICLAQKTDPVTGNTVNTAIRELEGKLSFQIWQYDSSKIIQRNIIQVTGGKSGSLQIENSIWKCDITESLPAKDGSVKVEARFKLEKGSLKSSGVAVAFDFKGWSTKLCYDTCYCL